MAVLNISISNITNGQELVLPFQVTGSVSAPQGFTISTLTRQIDNNSQVGITIFPANPTLFPFSFEISTTDCPTVGNWYMLTIYGWDNVGDCTVQSVTFKRVAGGGLPPP